MNWNDSWVWALIALLLAGMELMLGAGSFVFLALAAAALGGAVLAAFGGSIVLQLVGVGLLAGALVPLTIKRLGRHTTPAATGYGTTGTGVEHGQCHLTHLRDFDRATVITLKGDSFRVRDLHAPNRIIAPGTEVRLDHFEGTTAIVTLDTAAVIPDMTTNDTPREPL